MLRSQAVPARERSWMFENACYTFSRQLRPNRAERPGYKPPVHVCGSVASKSDVPRGTWSKMHVHFDGG
jgi:hypothetical protein